MLTVLPERNHEDAPWTIPMDIRQVTSDEHSTTIGQLQLKALLNHPQAPWFNELCVLDADSAYGNNTFLAPLGE